MKKLILIMIILACVFTAGCTNNVAQKPESLKDAYFTIIQKIENQEEVDIEYITELLEDYTSEQEELNRSLPYDDTVQLYIISNKNEKLIISDDGTEDKKVIELAYFKNDGLNAVSLGYGSSSSSNEILVIASVDDINIYEQICEIVENKNSKLSNNHHDISLNIATENTLTINGVKTLIDLEPISEDILDSNTSKEITRYSFQEEEAGEILSIYTLRDSKNISRATYHSNDQTSLTKDVIKQELIANGTSTIVNITCAVDNISTQNKIATLIFE